MREAEAGGAGVAGDTGGRGPPQAQTGLRAPASERFEGMTANTDMLLLSRVRGAPEGSLLVCIPWVWTNL